MDERLERNKRNARIDIFRCVKNRIARFLPAAIGCIGAACALLPTPNVTVKTLRSGSFTVDATGVVFDLRSGITEAKQPTVCMILDTLQYVFSPRAEHFHPLQLTDTTVYLRNNATRSTTPIVFKAVLEARNGERVDSGSGEYVPGNGMDTPYNQAHLLDEAGEVVCFGWSALRPGVTYVKLRLLTSQPIVVHDLTWHYLTRT
jgi:hypothetical protein